MMACNLSKNYKVEGNDSAIKELCCSCRRPGFGSWHSYVKVLMLMVPSTYNSSYSPQYYDNECSIYVQIQ